MKARIAIFAIFAIKQKKQFLHVDTQLLVSLIIDLAAQNHTREC